MEIIPGYLKHTSIPNPSQSCGIVICQKPIMTAILGVSVFRQQTLLSGRGCLP